MTIASFVISILSALTAITSLAYNAWRDHMREIHYQAHALSTWMTGTHIEGLASYDQKPMEEVILSNRSNQPVYDVVLSIGVQQSNYTFQKKSLATELAYATCTVIGVLPPGTFSSYAIAPDRGMCKRFQSIIAFRDTFGNTWIRNTDGKLKNLGKNTDPFKVMGCPLPPPYIVPITAVSL